MNICLSVPPHQGTVGSDEAPQRSIAAIRGHGAMIGFEIVMHRGGFELDADATKNLTSRALANGLILLSCGVYNNTIRIPVPLTASDAIVDEGFDIIEASKLIAA
jgi:4-aminobutyrate aminotransferase / (S)-3-amino-2-methylpropionate transaminase / 5-aminovalerate transaminase